ALPLNGTELPSNLLVCEGLTEYVKPKEQKPSPEFDFSVVPWNYVPVRRIEPSPLRDWCIVQYDNGNLALLQLNPRKGEDLYETLVSGWNIVTMARPTSRKTFVGTAIELAKEIVANLFWQGRRHDPFPSPAYGNRSRSGRTRTSEGRRVLAVGMARTVQVKVRGYSWELRHTYRHDGKIKTASLGTVPGKMR